MYLPLYQHHCHYLPSPLNVNLDLLLVTLMQATLLSWSQFNKQVVTVPVIEVNTFFFSSELLALKRYYILWMWQRNDVLNLLHEETIKWETR